MSINSRQDAAQLAGTLRDRGYETLDLSDNEMAKLHIRHMVGGPRPTCATSGSAGSSSRSAPAR